MSDDKSKEYSRKQAYLEAALSNAGGFIKPEYAAYTEAWMEENSGRINFRGTGHPDRPSPDFLKDVVDKNHAEGKKYNYISTGTDSQKRAVARYFAMMNLPDSEWEQLMEDAKGKTTSDYPEILSALEEKLDSYVDKNEILLTPNGTFAFASLMAVLTDPGDKILAAAPYYNAYTTAAEPLGIDIERINSKAEDNFVFRKGEATTVFLKNPDAKAIFFQSSNPTGSTTKKENAESIADELMAIKQIELDSDFREGILGEGKDWPENKERTLLVFDQVYNELSNGEDHPVLKILWERYADPKYDNDIIEAILHDSVQITSMSKIGSIAAFMGAIQTQNKEVKSKLEEFSRSVILSVNPLSADVTEEFFKRVIENKAGILLQGKDPRTNGIIFDIGKEYEKERDFMIEGFERVAESFDIIDRDKGETLFPHEAKKALYAFPMIVKMLEKFDVPDVDVFVNDADKKDSRKAINLRDFVFDDKDKKKITTGIEAARFLYAMAGRSDPDKRVGVQGRPGEWFGFDEGGIRLNITGSRKDHQEVINVLIDSMKFMGAEMVKKFNMPTHKELGQSTIDGEPSGELGSLFSAEQLKEMEKNQGR